MKKIINEWRKHIKEQALPMGFPVIVRYLQLTKMDGGDNLLKAYELVQKNKLYVERFIKELNGMIEMSPEEAKRQAAEFDKEDTAYNQYTGKDLFGSEARSPKSVYTRKGNKYFIDGKPANSQQAAQIKKALEDKLQAV